MRGLGLLTLLFATRVRGHPQCFYDGRPTDPDQVLTFCPAATDGACCTDFEEAIVEARFEAVGTVSAECGELYQQVVCGVCHSYSGHLYERLGGELGALDGMTMKDDFCQELVSACAGEITFPTYDGEDYCTKHTGGGDDFFWSYPYEEADIFNADLTEVFSGSADFPSQTIGVTQTPDGSAFWLMGQAGEVNAVDASDLSTTSTVVDISSLDLYLAYEEGLVGMAFGPMFGVTGYPSYFYLSYTVQLDAAEMPRNRLAKFEYVAGDAASTLASAEILMTSVPKLGTFHSAGWVGFKPSDYGNAAASHQLYWSMGDSGPHLDTGNNAQDTTNLHGSIIRISVPSDGTGYTIPSGNLGSPALPEICAHGFRNPWRCSFDRDTEELYCGDVGHTLVEEVDIIECGNNYGWAQFEGSRCVEDNEDRFGACADADRSGYTFPIFEYCHPDYFDDTAAEAEFVAGVDICGDRQVSGSAIIGGFVYRGTYFDDLLAGAYIFGDNTSKNIYYIMENGGEWMVGSIVSDGSVDIIAFSETNEGEIMMITTDYSIYHMPCGDLCVTASTCLAQAEDMPTYESLGCFTDVNADRALEIDESKTCSLEERAMTPAICASYCSTLEATYMGVQFGYECFCGNSADYSRHGTSSACTYVCSGNPAETCGGQFAIEVYELGEPLGQDSSNLVLAGGPGAVGATATREEDSSASSRVSPSGSMVNILSCLVGFMLAGLMKG